MKIILAGFMGSGKSTVSQILGEMLSMPVLEMDERIIELSNTSSIPRIFETDGEEEFRRLETAVCREVSTQDNIIVSTGGGAVQNAGNADLLQSGESVMIYLKTSFSTILKRVGDTSNRPLLQDLEAARALHEKRDPVYTAVADLTIDTNEKTVQTVAEEIREALQDRS
jgi:3-dehydroquinate synthase